MNRYGPVCHEARSYGGFDAELKIRPLEGKCRLTTPPGQHGPKGGKRKRSVYGGQLLAKQQLRTRYGRMKEHQFRSLFKEADRQKGNTGVILLQLLETRLDNVLFRMGLASTRAEARQLISHKAIMVVRTQKRKDESGAEIVTTKEMVVTSRSFQTKAGDVIKVRERAMKQERINDALKLAEERGTPDWVSVNAKDKEGTVQSIPQGDDLPSDVDVQLVIELYSK